MKKTILVVEDDYFVRTLLDFLLQDKFKVVAIENGFKAMLWLDKGNIPDLVLSDLDMPEINGFNLLHHLRKSGYYRNVPVIMLSGHNKPEIQQACLESGASGFITKPFNPPQLLNSIYLILERSEVFTHNEIKDA